MAKEMPVGTIREWADGMYIKASSVVGNKFDGNWIPLKQVPTHIQDLASELTRTANSVAHMKEPIDGMLYLDYELKNFELDPPFDPSEFKRWGEKRYAFREVIFKRYLQKYITLHDNIQTALENANEEKGIQLGKTQEQLKQVFLSKDEVAEIRAKIRSEVGDDFDPGISEKHLKKLLEVIKRTTDNIKKGVNFEGTEKEAYDKAVEIANSLPLDYDRLPKKKEQVNQAIKIINEAFPDNWGIRQTFRLKVEDQYRSYLNKYRSRIKEDEGKEQEERFGVKLDDDHETFYKAILSKVEDDVVRISSVDLDLHLGKNFTVNDSIFGTLQRSSTSTTGYEILRANGRFYDIDDDKILFNIQSQVSPPKYPFSELLELRFNLKYGLELSGDWDFTLLPSLQEMERTINFVPPGHVLSNSHIKRFETEKGLGGDHGLYAWYDSSLRSINFSKECTKYAKLYASRDDMNEFRSTLAHEIGHAVSQKFGRHRNLDYKKFAVECGWSYQQQEVRGGKTATGKDKDIPRYGSNSGIPLVTEYAHKSPEEAFAEYYSFYTLYKDDMDKWLEGKLPIEKTLNKGSHVRVEAGSYSSTVGSQPYFHTSSEMVSSEIVDQVSQQLEKNDLDFSRVKIELLDPWSVGLHKKIKTSDYDQNLSRNYLPTRKNPNPLFAEKVPLIVSVDHGNGKIQAISDLAYTGLHIAKSKRSATPSIVIPKEFYNYHLDKGLSSHEIAGAYLQLLKSRNPQTYIPSVKDATMVFEEGIPYRGKIITLQTLKRNFRVFSAMKKIWESDELKKALEELGILRPEVKKKKTSTAAIVRNMDGDILLLRRSNLDSFHPGTWCLPGGGVDEGETPDDGVVRELMEETGLKCINFRPLKVYELEEIDIHYYECSVFATELLLDNNEHGNYKFCSIDEWMEMDLILDLKSHLVEMLPLFLGVPIDLPSDDDLEKGERNGLVAKKVVDKNGKTVTRWVKAIPEGSSQLKEYLRNIVTIFGNDNTSKQKLFYSWQLESSKDIKVDSIKELQKEFPELINYFKKNPPQTKQCYRNSSHFVMTAMLKDPSIDIRYVEGLMTIHGIPIEHAWVKVGNKYYDPTLELALKGKPGDREYLSIVELEPDEMILHMNSTQTYGPYMLETFKDIKKLK